MSARITFRFGNLGTKLGDDSSLSAYSCRFGNYQRLFLMDFIQKTPTKHRTVHISDFMKPERYDGSLYFS
jgi:hypothetical protein